MLRLLSTLLLGIALGYCMFFVRLEGRSIAAHLGDVWSSPVVQQKVRLVEREVPRALKGSLPQKLPRPPGRPPADADTADKTSHEAHTADDRRNLNRLVHRAHRGEARASRPPHQQQP